jgi:hypothetical protein
VQDQSNPQNAIFQALDAVPSQVWYTAGVVSILASAGCQLAGKQQLALFIGQWPPTFFVVGLYHQLLRPGSEDARAQVSRAAEQAANAPQNLQEPLP